MPNRSPVPRKMIRAGVENVWQFTENKRATRRYYPMASRLFPESKVSMAGKGNMLIGHHTSVDRIAPWGGGREI